MTPPRVAALTLWGRNEPGSEEIRWWRLYRSVLI
jgi:hypothetical protein